LPFGRRLSNDTDQATVAELQRRLDAKDAELREAQAKLQQMEQEFGETTSRLRLQVRLRTWHAKAD